MRGPCHPSQEPPSGVRANGIPVHSPAGVDAEQTRPAPSPFLQVAKIAYFTQPGAVRGDDDTVAYGEITDLEGLEQPPKTPRFAAKSCSPLPAPP